ncbi:hypothetical protein INR49_026185 [Caranx melampygus]|nr:hypothetical protein INR49_026185 [Caranx melampygus]
MRTSSPVAAQVHSDLSLVTSFPLTGCAEAVLDWRPAFSPDFSLFCPLSTPRPLRPLPLEQLPNICWWQMQARTRRMLRLVN